ncbi:hypothetical protein [Kribbella sp. NPDC051620]|uniref:hypothetical protein n=1 Tax=Kribbella sp. NPDC051620 TaxID=3364120 RepID=UPI0037B5F82D
MTFGPESIAAVTDASWPDKVEVAFDPDELHRERMTVLRGLRLTGWGWLILAGVASVAIVLPLAGSAIDGLWPLAAIWVALIAGMLWTSARSFSALARCSGWRNGEQPKYALRLSADGLWIAGTATYGWQSIQALRTRTAFRRTYLIVRLKTGVRPDAPIVAGLAELGQPGERRLPITPRGPRLLVKTLQLEDTDIARAVRHYSKGQLTISG